DQERVARDVRVDVPSGPDGDVHDGATGLAHEVPGDHLLVGHGTRRDHRRDRERGDEHPAPDPGQRSFTTLAARVSASVAAGAATDPPTVSGTHSTISSP